MSGEDGNGAIILVVEDVEETRDGIEDLLNADGYRPMPARHEEDAVERARRQTSRPDPGEFGRARRRSYCSRHAQGSSRLRHRTGSSSSRESAKLASALCPDELPQYWKPSINHPRCTPATRKGKSPRRESTLAVATRCALAALACLPCRQRDPMLSLKHAAWSTAAWPLAWGELKGDKP